MKARGALRLHACGLLSTCARSPAAADPRKEAAPARALTEGSICNGRTRHIMEKKRTAKLAVVVAAALSVGVLAVSGAQAVHDTGRFQLDGDASSATQPPPPYPQAVDDWDKVCHQVTHTDCSTTSDTTGATAVTWQSDGDLNSTIFTGGGSKDPINIDQWAWKDGAGGLPDKDNLLHAYAVRYSLASGPHCPGVGGDTSGATTCDVIYFGSDRFDNSGDAQQGF